MCLTDGRRYKKMAIRDLGQPRLAKGRWLRIQALLIGLAAPVIAHSDINLAADSAAAPNDYLATYLAEALSSNSALQAQAFAVEAAAQG